MKLVKKILLGLLLIFIIAQFFGPKKDECSKKSLTAFFEETKPPQNIKTFLIEACFNCDNNKKNYPWYTKITPVNYWLANRLKYEGKHFNVSGWENNSVKIKDHKFEALITMVKMKQRPYTWASEVKLDAQEIKDFLKWAENVRLGYSLVPKPE